MQDHLSHACASENIDSVSVSAAGAGTSPSTIPSAATTTTPPTSDSATDSATDSPVLKWLVALKIPLAAATRYRWSDSHAQFTHSLYFHSLSNKKQFNVLSFTDNM